MRLYLLLVILLYSPLINAQNQGDTVINKLYLTSLRTQISILKEKIKKTELDNYFKVNFYKIDTVFKSKDSSKIKFIAKNGAVLREEIKTYIKRSSFTSDSLIMSDSIITFYNDKGLVEYIEGWTDIATISFDSPETGMTQYLSIEKPILNHYIRIEYDSLDRESVIVMRLPTIITRLKRHYDENGNLLTTTTEEIEETEFWY